MPDTSALMPQARSAPIINQNRAALTIAANLLLLLIGSGTMYGYNALRPVLIDDGAYSEKCPIGGSGCAEQRLSLNFAETMSFVVSDISYLPCGLLMDYLGTRNLSWVLAGLYFSGFGLMNAASRSKTGWVYMTSLLILGGAPSSAYLMGLASAKMLWDVRYTHWVSAGVSLCYEVSPMFMYLLQLVVPGIMSFQSVMSLFAFATAGFCIVMGLTHLTYDEARRIDKSQGRREEEKDGELWGHLFHVRYLLQSYFMIVVNTKNQFYVATFADQIDYFSNPEESKLSNYLFDVGFFLSPIFATPFVIMFLTHYQNRYDLVFAWLWVMTMCHAVLNTFGKESLTCQMIAMVIFWILKPLKWASAAEFLHKAPYKLAMYGRLFGVVSIACGGGAAFIYPLTKLSYDYFGGSFFEANLILTIFEFTVVAFPLYLHYEHRYDIPKSPQSAEQQTWDTEGGGSSAYRALPSDAALKNRAISPS